MDSRPLTEGRVTPDATEFVRFCHRRRAVGWPELYDEMCHVASRGLFRGWGTDELAEHGIGFSLFETPALAALVARVVTEEQAQRRGRAGLIVGSRRAGRAAPEQDAAEPEEQAPPIPHLAGLVAG